MPLPKPLRSRASEKEKSPLKKKKPAQKSTRSTGGNVTEGHCSGL